MNKELRIKTTKISSLLPPYSISNIRSSCKAKGFTLVELLIVMSLISMLVAVGVVSFRSSQIRAQDARRKSDIRQYQNALEIYANTNNGLYPYEPTAIRASTDLCSIIQFQSCPEDPRPGSSTLYYMYYSQGGLTSGTPSARSYVLYANLDSTNEYWVACSDGRSGTLPGTTAINPPNCPL